MVSGAYTSKHLFVFMLGSFADMGPPWQVPAGLAYASW